MKIDIKGEEILQEIEKMTEEQFKKAMNDLVLDMVNSATEKAYEGNAGLGGRSNRLKGDIVNNSGVEDKGKVIEGKVEATVKYAEYVEHGTGIYADTHRGGKRTKYIGKIPKLKGKHGAKDKGWRIIKGQKPKHFMLRTKEEYESKLQDYFKLKR